MTKRTLHLKREALTELSSAELGGIAAAADELTPACPRTVVVRECIGGISDVHTCLDCLTRSGC